MYSTPVLINITASKSAKDGLSTIIELIKESIRLGSIVFTILVISGVPTWASSFGGRGQIYPRGGLGLGNP